MSAETFMAMVQGFCRAIENLRIQQQELFQRNCSLNLMLANNSTWAETTEWMIENLVEAFSGAYPKVAPQIAKLGEGLIEGTRKLRRDFEGLIRKHPNVEMAVGTNKDWAGSASDSMGYMWRAFSATQKFTMTVEKLAKGEL